MAHVNTILCGRWNRHSSVHDQTKTLHAMRNLLDKGEAADGALRHTQDDVERLVITMLDASGVSIIGDGGIRWDSLFDVARPIKGCHGFEQLTRIPKTNHFHRQPRATLPLSHAPLKLNDLRFAQQHSKKPIAITLPGPYVLASQTENVETLGLRELAAAYAQVLNQEIKMLLNAGAALVRIEEPYIIHRPHEFSLFADLMRMLTAHVDISRLILAAWYGSVEHLPGYFNLPFDIFWLDFVEGKGNLSAITSFPSDKQLIAGIFDARHTYQETDEELHSLFAAITAHVSEDRLMLSANTDLHFLPWDRAYQKAQRLVRFAQQPKTSYRVPPGTSRVLPQHHSSDHTSLPDTPIQPSIAPLSFIPRIPFITSAVGSYPQHPEMRSARIRLKKGELDEPSYRAIIERHTRRWIEFQEKIDMTIPVGGEFLREDMAVYFSEAFGGHKLDFVPSYENRRYRPIEFFNPIQEPPASLCADDFRFLTSLSARPIKETITGPTTLAEWALLSHPEYYHNRRALRRALSRALHREISLLADSGVKILQVDEPALTTNMDNLTVDLEAIEETIRGHDARLYLILHICYSDMDALDGAFPYILKLPFHQIHMEMANRNYLLLNLIKKHGFGEKDIGAGVIDVHTDRVETADEIVAGVQKLLHYFSPEKIWLTPDCGLKERTDDVAQEKLRSMCEAARICRAKFGS